MSKAGTPVDARIVNTSSGAGLFGSVSQANYSTAKAGIATFTTIAAAELGRYGVFANGIAPSARSRTVLSPTLRVLSPFGHSTVTVTR